MKPAPDSLPLDCLDIARLIQCVGPANAAIARYDGLLQSVVHPSVMLSPPPQHSRTALSNRRYSGNSGWRSEN